ncbi:MAG TPA: LytTR family DNA-binding domain-containing protein [Thermoanaerobaculia bacterium]|nr:LytTR family DNA-binding domain-containing protein [Thermoanaerobaculia bacterium]
MSRFRVLVADDEPLARGIVVDLVAADADAEVVAECGDGESTRCAIRRERPDILFLDIEMPELDGLEVHESLDDEELPAVVYVTAYQRYAARAFDVAAIDYLVKPFSDERFATAFERAKQRVRERRLGALAEQVAQLAEELTTGSSEPAGEQRRRPLDRLSIKASSRSLIIPAEEIVWIESEDYYVRVHSAQGRHLLRASLDRLEERLDPTRFVRVHRRALVAVPEVREVVELFKGARAAVLSDGCRVRISRARWKAIQPVLLPTP